MSQTRLSRKLQDIQVNIDAYSIIGWLAMLAVPIAPMIYFGWRVYSSVLDETNHEWLAIAAAVVTAVGLEITGVLAGHRAMAFWRLGDIRRATLAGCILGAYILIGVHELSNGFKDVTIGATVFVIAPLVYLLVALGEVLEHEEATETAVSGFQLEQDAKEADHRREMENKQLELDAANALQIQLAHERGQIEIALAAEKTKVTIANAEARKAKLSAKVDESKPAKGENHTKAGDLSGTPLLVFEALQRNPRASNVEIAESLPITPQRVGQIRKELNGIIEEAS